MATRPSWRKLFMAGALVALPAVALTPTRVHTVAANQAKSAVADAVSTAGLPPGYSISISDNGMIVTVTLPGGIQVTIDLSKVPNVGKVTFGPDGTIQVYDKNGNLAQTGSLNITAPAGEHILLQALNAALGGTVTIDWATPAPILVAFIQDLFNNVSAVGAAHTGPVAPVVTFKHTTVRMTDGSFLYTYDNALCGQRYLYQNTILAQTAQVGTLARAIAAIRPAATLNKEIATLNATIKRLSPSKQKALIARDRAQIAKDRTQLATLRRDTASLASIRTALGHEWGGLARDNKALKGDACHPADVNKNILSFNAHGDLHISVALLNMMHAKLAFQKTS